MIDHSPFAVATLITNLRITWMNLLFFSNPSCITITLYLRQVLMHDASGVSSNGSYGYRVLVRVSATVVGEWVSAFVWIMYSRQKWIQGCILCLEV